ncbi:MAG: thiol peroxidase [Propionibacteriaceae bacterium]|nr:thiol peroxidase [Propionibacteriaceae bacterium]
MATTTFNDEVIRTNGELPAVGEPLPSFVLTGTDLADVTNESFAGRTIVFNIFPSVDTGVCAMSVRQFNKMASELPNTVVICASMDLPFALGRFCGAEGIENVISASAFRSDFGHKFGVTMIDGGLQGLFARCIVVADAAGNVIYTDITSAVGDEPNYEAAVLAVIS